MWDLSRNDGSTANALMHIIIYSTVYKKKKKSFVFVSVALDFTFIRKKRGVTVFAIEQLF